MAEVTPDPIGGVGARIAGIFAAIVSLAVVAIVLSNGANTVNVIAAFFSGLGSLIGIAISPITGNNTAANNAIAALGQPLSGNLVGLGTSSLGSSTASTTGTALAGTGVALTGVGNAAQGISNLLTSLGSSGGGSLGSGSGYVDTGSFDV